METLTSYVLIILLRLVDRIPSIFLMILSNVFIVFIITLTFLALGVFLLACVWLYLWIASHLSRYAIVLFKAIRQISFPWHNNNHPPTIPTEAIPPEVVPLPLEPKIAPVVKHPPKFPLVKRQRRSASSSVEPKGIKKEVKTELEATYETTTAAPLQTRSRLRKHVSLTTLERESVTPPNTPESNDSEQSLELRLFPPEIATARPFRYPPLKREPISLLDPSVSSKYFLPFTENLRSPKRARYSLDSPSSSAISRVPSTPARGSLRSRYLSPLKEAFSPPSRNTTTFP